LESQYRFLSGLVCSWTAGGTPAGEFKVKLLAESERALQSAIVLQPFYANYYAAAGGVYRSWALKMDQSKLGAALGCYEKALRISPYNVDIRNEFADLLYHANRREEAAAQLENSASIDPGYWSTLYLLTRSLVELGRQERARYWLAEAVRADPEVWDIADDLRRQYKLQEHQ